MSLGTVVITANRRQPPHSAPILSPKKVHPIDLRLHVRDRTVEAVDMSSIDDLARAAEIQSQRLRELTLEVDGVVSALPGVDAGLQRAAARRTASSTSSVSSPLPPARGIGSDPPAASSGSSPPCRHFPRPRLVVVVGCRRERIRRGRRLLGSGIDGPAVLAGSLRPSF